MLDQRWYSQSFPCPKCGTTMELMSFAYSADGQFQFMFSCENCGMMLSWSPFASQLQEMARRADYALEFKSGAEEEKERGPVRPPMAEKPEEMTDEDRKFLKDLGIEEKGDGDETL